MSLYSSQFTINNKSGYNLTLNTKESSGLGNGNWPTSISNGSQGQTGVQTGNVNINFTAVYDVEGTNASVLLHFYIAVFGLGHLGMSLLANGTYLSDSSITQNNVQPYSADTPPLVISVTNTSVTSGLTTGNFTIGPLSF